MEGLNNMRNQTHHPQPEMKTEMRMAMMRKRKKTLLTVIKSHSFGISATSWVTQESKKMSTVDSSL